ncbi:CCE_0567 family metalloprotein [Acidithiobacillus ferrianus]|uniref:CCE_0567 family metalloprotein n=1 Tax=Acidithiobacillus ferrianus TaxID=2678518 RepID=UPI0034E3FAD5
MTTCMEMLPVVEEKTNHWELIVDEKDALKTDIKRLNAQATQAKMDLHDLAEDLPVGWENILDLANRTYAAYRDLMAARARLASFPGG